ncbi:hypothetical protein RF11_08128 [Thelohanellus kitauei]|uniref:Uncharacterized protein n=1 Tax=Thelohanellus kitauei TaxID=669202 RepID=A0A0C2J3T1_THEKT|nr:hypothetical protein RF11_08128 [Thelohanellus kitauei]
MSDAKISELISLLSKQIELQERRLNEQAKLQQEQLKVQQEQMSAIISKVCNNAEAKGCTDKEFTPFDPSSELWFDYHSRFLTFSEANRISDERKPLTFLTSQSREIYKLVQTAGAQLDTPTDINSLTWPQILDIMKRNFGDQCFLVRERYRFYTETKRDSGESIQELASKIRLKAMNCDFGSVKNPLEEALKTAFVCAVNNESVLRTIFHKHSEDLSFNEVVEIAKEVEGAMNTAKAQLKDNPSQGRRTSKETAVEPRISAKGVLLQL